MDDADDHFRTAVDAAQLPVWEYDVARDRVTGNVHWHRNLGHDLTEEQAAQRVETWLSDVHPDDIAGFGHIFTGSGVDANGFYEAEFRIRTRSGDYKWLLERGRIVARDAAGRPAKLVGIAIDIDARKRMADALRATERSRRAVIDASPIPFALNDDQGNITFVNRAFTATFGYSVADVPTLVDWREVAYPDPAYRRWVADTWTMRRETAVREQTPFEPLEVVVRCKDGSERIAIAYAATLTEPEAGAHLVVLLDVTQQRQLETAALAAVSREQRRIGMDLHDGLGQKLTGLSLMLSVLARDANSRGLPAVGSELTKLAEMTRACVGSVREIAHGLAPTELGSAGVARLLRTLAYSTQVAFGLQVGLKLFGFGEVTLDERLSETLYRIAQEALTNVAKHANATRVHIEGRLSIGTLTLSIRDNGGGLKAGSRGDGLGLGSMRYRASSVGGRIEITLPASGGTVVRFACPIRVQGGLVSPRRTAAPEPASGPPASPATR